MPGASRTFEDDCFSTGQGRSLPGKVTVRADLGKRQVTFVVEGLGVGGRVAKVCPKSVYKFQTAAVRRRSERVEAVGL
jgi:hypothetical protein